MQTSNLKTVAAILLAGSLVLPFAAPIRAQESPKQGVNVNDDQLRSFAKAYVQVEKIRQVYQPRLEQAKTPEESDQIGNEAESKMEAAVAKEGMTKESYSHIVEIARADEGLRKKLINMINEEKQKS